MLVFKLAGAALLIICGGLTGRALCESSEVALCRTEGFISLLKYIRNQIDCYLMPVDKILSGCPADILDSCGACPGIRSFTELLETCDGKLPPDTAALLEKFAAELGTTYRDTQLKLCDYYINKLTAERDKLQSEAPAHRKMIMTLCICVAAGIALIMF